MGVLSLFRRDTSLSFMGGLGWLELGALSFGGFLGLVGLILGVLALGAIRRANGRLGGHGLALMGVLGVPFGLAVTLSPGLILALGGAGYLPAALGGRLYEVAPLWLLGLLVAVVVRLNRWTTQSVSPRADGVKGGSLAMGVGTWTLVLVLLASAVMLALKRPQTGRLAARNAVESTPGPTAGPRPLTGGFHFDFTLPAGQVAVFEVVTRRRGEILPLPKLAAHALAPAGQDFAGALRFERDPANDIPGLRRPWQIELRCSNGVSSIAGVDFPSNMAAAIGASSLGQVLRPDSEVIEWFHPGSERQPAVGLRVRTQAHGRSADEINRGVAFHLGTNWTVVASGAVPAGTGVDIELRVPPRETFIVHGIVRSNGVPVDAGELRAKLWPPGTRTTSPYRLSWQPLAVAANTTNGAPWEIVVEDGTSKTIAARLRPGNLPRLEWTLSPAASDVRVKAVGREAQTFEVARALQEGGGVDGAAVDWSLRVRLQSSPVPPGTARRGADVEFVLPANQAVTFELVTRSHGRVTPVPNLAAYVVNRADEAWTGKFLLADDPDDLDSLTGVPRWKFGIVGPGQRLLETGPPPIVPIPDDLAGNRHWNLESWKRLEPDTEFIAGQATSDVPGFSYGLRIRTTTVVATPGLRQHVAGFGTNWLQAIAGGEAGVLPRSPRGVQVSLGVPRGQGVLIELLTARREGVSPLPGSAGYLLASAARDVSAVVGWMPNPVAPAGEAGTVPWQVVLRGDRGVVLASATNLVLPEDLARLVPGGGSTLAAGWLDPDAESVHWIEERAGSDRPGLGVRLRTFAHGLGVVELPERGFGGMGTNWAAEFPPEVRTAPPVYRLDHGAQPHPAP
jgi:hypothetical protein